MRGSVQSHRRKPKFAQHFPAPDWVEQEADDLWTTTLDCARQAIEKSGAIPAATGITNQREITVLWDRATGRPLHRAIVWQDRRTADHGRTAPGLFAAEIPIAGVAGDQQAATIGQVCFQPGMMKSTYGTGCIALLNIGAEKITSCNRLLTTIAFRLNGQTTYALEGSIFIAGAVVQWLRDGLQMRLGRRVTPKPLPRHQILRPASSSCPPSPAMARRGGG